MGASQVPVRSASIWAQIATSSLSGVSNVSFTSIPNYSELLISWKSTYTLGYGELLRIRFNSDTGSNYSYLFTDNTAPIVSSGTATSIGMGSLSSNSSPTNSGSVLIKGSNDIYKTITFNNTAAAINGAGDWFNSASITSISFIGSTGGGTFTAGTVTLYGRS